MQFHTDGFHGGDPETFKPAKGRESGQGTLPEKLDVLVVGSGPAGLNMAAQLATFPQINARIIEQKESRMILGQADGLSCRSLEMFNAFGFAYKIMNEGYHVNETTFWVPDPENVANITRTARVNDVKKGISEMPHIVLNQARVHDMYLEVMSKSASRLEVDYGHKLINLEINQEGEYPNIATIECNGEIKKVHTKYVVGCDSARSVVRKAIGRELIGDYANQPWGVVDILPLTTFPDIHYKSIIKSEEGNIIIIPREGGHLVRLYISLDKIEKRGDSKSITLDFLIEKAKKIFHPYEFESKEVSWWTVYEVGHSVTDKFDDVPEDEMDSRMPHVFIAGDACHTHSAKAGQGMNVSMGDSFNLGWKLISVLLGNSDEKLLHTYSGERLAVARGLVEYDHKWSRFMGAPLDDNETFADAAERIKGQFLKGGTFTAGLSVQYTPSLLTGEATYQDLATKIEIGKRFHSATVIRLGDAKTVHLGHVTKTDAKWRLFAFADGSDPMSNDSTIYKLCDYLAKSPNSPIVKYTAKNEDIDSLISLYGIFQQKHYDLRFEDMHPLLKPNVGKYGLIDYEKIYSIDSKNQEDIFDLRGISKEKGCILIIRPDQYVAHILPLDAYEELEKFFDGFLLRKN